MTHIDIFTIAGSILIQSLKNNTEPTISHIKIKSLKTFNKTCPIILLLVATHIPTNNMADIVIDDLTINQVLTSISIVLQAEMSFLKIIPIHNSYNGKPSAQIAIGKKQHKHIKNLDK